MNYESTKKFWNNMFTKKSSGVNINEEDDLLKKLKLIKSFLTENCEKILDYGFGTGSFLIEMMTSDIKEGYGIELSEKGIEICQENSLKKNIKNLNLLLGGVEKIQDFSNDFFDSVIISNVLDNLILSDSKKLLEEAHRTLKINGKLYIKLNDYINDEELLKNTSIFEKEIEEDFYLETSGLYFWNISDEKFENLIKDKFTVEDKFKIHFKKHDAYNRVWLLKKQA